MQSFDVLGADLPVDDGDPEGYRGGCASLAAAIGMAKLAGSVYELPPGQSVCPYHWEAGDEELLLVLRGEVSVRHPEGEDTLRQGALVCFPAGPAGAHKVTNRSSETVRILMLSTAIDPAVVIYPDSNKLGAFDKPSGTRMFLRIGESVDYYEGELR
jgi:uncharacterized cupin superfamily protein